MNHHLCDFIVMTTQREGEVTIKYVEEECSFLESIFFSIPALPNSPNVNDQYHNAEE